MFGTSNFLCIAPLKINAFLIASPRTILSNFNNHMTIFQTQTRFHDSRHNFTIQCFDKELNKVIK